MRARCVRRIENLRSTCTKYLINVAFLKRSPSLDDGAVIRNNHAIKIAPCSRRCSFIYMDWTRWWHLRWCLSPESHSSEIYVSMVTLRRWTKCEWVMTELAILIAWRVMNGMNSSIFVNIDLRFSIKMTFWICARNLNCSCKSCTF